MKIFSINDYLFSLPEGHRFPLEKYRMLEQQVRAQLVPPGKVLVPDAATRAELLLAHTREYLDAVFAGSLSEKAIRRIGLPWSPELVERSRRSVGGTIAAARAALEEGVAASLSGGTHHACSDHGQGFCVFNDVAVALRVLRAEGRLHRALVLDCDVHQGNGTAEILKADPDFITFSIHGENNFPFRKIPGDYDIALPDGIGDEVYLDALEPAAEYALAQANPDLLIYLAGADPYIGDRLGRLNLTMGGLLRRDRLVLDLVEHAGVPVVIVMSGGYGREVADTVAIHLQTLDLAINLWRRLQTQTIRSQAPGR